MANQELIELLQDKIARLQKAHVLATDEDVKINLEHKIRESEELLRQYGGGTTPAEKPTPSAPAPAPPPPPPQAATPLPATPAATTPHPNPAPAQTSETPPASASSPPWWMIAAGAAVATFLLAWWMLTDAKIAALIAVGVGLWLLFRNPELIYQRLALTAMGLVVVLNAINLSGFLDGRVGDNKFRLELTEPSIIVSLGLLVFAGYMMYLHSRRKG